jgi:hypothetical protein
MPGQRHHLDLTIGDLGWSKLFHDPVLRLRGLAIRRAQRRRGHSRYTAGLHHFAWNACSRANVDRLHGKLIEALRLTGMTHSLAIFEMHIV